MGGIGILIIILSISLDFLELSHIKFLWYSGCNFSLSNRVDNVLKG